MVRYNKLLQAHCRGVNETYVCLPQPGAGLRFRLVTPEEYNRLQKKPGASRHNVNGGIRLLTGLTETGPPSDSPYPVVSQWLVDEDKKQGLHKEDISYRFSEILVDVYGCGFGSRNCSSTTGSNIYLGTRSSHQSSASPTEGPGNASISQYYRSYYCLPVFRAWLEKRSRDFLRRAQVFSSKMDYLMNRFVPPTEEASALWTLGGNTGQVFGFHNSLHVDKSDKMNPAEQRHKMEKAVTDCEGCESLYTASVLAYLQKFSQMVGLGHTTTCAYRHVYHPHANKELFLVFQFFVMAGLGATCPLVDKVAHLFSAFALSHYTSCCVVVQNGLVHWTWDGSVNVVAWGSWENSKKQKRRKKEEADDSDSNLTDVPSPVTDETLVEIVENPSYNNEHFTASDNEGPVDRDTKPAAQKSKKRRGIPPLDEELDVSIAGVATLVKKTKTLSDSSSSDDEEDIAYNKAFKKAFREKTAKRLSESDSSKKERILSSEEEEYLAYMKPSRERKATRLSDLSKKKSILSGPSSDEEEDQRPRPPSMEQKTSRLTDSSSKVASRAVPSLSSLSSVPRKKEGSKGQDVIPEPPNRLGARMMNEKFTFYEGLDQTWSIGQVHEVRGDGNCGFYCLLIALAALRTDLKDRPKSALLMRQKLKRLMHGVDPNGKLELGRILLHGSDDDEIKEEWALTKANLYNPRYKKNT